MKRLIEAILVVALVATVSCTQGNKNTASLTAELQAKLDKYRGDLEILQKQVSALKTQLVASEGQSTLSISQLQEGLANERDILSTIEGYLSLPFNVSRCECYDLSDTQRAKVVKEITSIKQKLALLESNSALSQSCPEAVEIHKEFLRERRYILGVEQALTSKSCGQRPTKKVTVQTTSGLVDLAQSEYQTNLRAKNWCYGKLTEEQVKLLWFAYTVKNNVTNCPVATPYYDGEKCFNCEAPKAFFDLSAKQCVNAQSVDASRKCVGVGAVKQQKNQTVEEDTGPTYKDVTVTPLEADPIVKSVTYNKERKTVDKIVQPIEGKAILDKRKTLTNINYVEVEPVEADPLVKIRKVRRTSSSSRRSSSSTRGSSSSKHSSSSSSSSKSSSGTNTQQHQQLSQF